MVAVVDATAEFGVEVGAAAPSGVIACLIKAYLAPGRSERHGRSKPGEPGADDVRRSARRRVAHASP
jgi:hypothetical protein